jgi:hypothetical protein
MLGMVTMEWAYPVVVIAGISAMIFGVIIRKALKFYPPLLKLEDRIVELYEVTFYTFKVKERVLELILESGETIILNGEKAIHCFQIIQEYGHLFDFTGIIEGQFQKTAVS